MLGKFGDDLFLVPTEGAGVAFYRMDEETFSPLHRRVPANVLISELSVSLKLLRKTEGYLAVNGRSKAVLLNLLSGAGIDLAHRLFEGFRFDNALADDHLGWVESSQVKIFTNSLASLDLDVIFNGSRKDEILEYMTLFRGPSFENQFHEAKSSFQKLVKFFDQASRRNQAIVITKGLSDSMPSLQSRMRLHQKESPAVWQTTLHAVESDIISSLSSRIADRAEDQAQGDIDTLKTVRLIQKDPATSRFTVLSDLIWALGFISIIGGQTLRIPGIVKCHAVASAKLRSLAESMVPLHEPLRSHLGGLSRMAEKHRQEGLALTEIEERIKTLVSFYAKAASDGRALLIVCEAIDAKRD